tara:strand:+ start:1048 stop:1629 length:582 start_codon:yes stop_codon:yes gene_type:complete
MKLLIFLIMLLMLGAGEKPEQPVTLKTIYAKEYMQIAEGALQNGCEDPVLFCIVFAIRNAENGRKGLEFGVMHPRAVDQPNSLRVQAGWCAATVYKNYQRWLKSDSKLDFIEFLGSRYCPTGVENDPDNLNQYWITNVKAFAQRNLTVHLQNGNQQKYEWLTLEQYKHDLHKDSGEVRCFKAVCNTHSQKDAK